METGNTRPRTEGSELHTQHQEISRSKRHLPPAHYTLKVKAYSLLAKADDRYETGVFEAGGYKWRLFFYPNGDKKNKGVNHVSLYLALAETDTFPHRNWEVNVNFKLFVHDQIEDRYLTIQDANGIVRRFHEMKTTWGFAQLLPLEIFKDPSNGYLVDDTCVFGVEVFVIKPTGNSETLSLTASGDISNATFTWEIEEFSACGNELYNSKVFTVGGKNWYLQIYPKGDNRANGKSISLYLCRGDDWGSCRTKAAVYAKYKLRLLNQENGKHVEREGSNFFDASKGVGRGYINFISLEDLRKPSSGFILKDTLIVEVEFVVVSETKCFSESPAAQSKENTHERISSVLLKSPKANKKLLGSD